ncbi:MAG: hypothetical protein HY288_17095 [Planctomycetia bacterium]|nr:hypothetical protein [Planctomycetia bacterium]
MRIVTRTLAVGLCLGCVAASSAAAQESLRGPRRPGAGDDPRREGALKAGDLAPDFTLSTLDGKRKITLSDFRGKRPVALMFGSYT